MLAPAMGQLVLVVADWRAIFLVFLALAAVVAIWLGVRQPETLAPARRIPFSLPALLLNGALILRHRKVMAYTLALGFLFAALLLYVSIAPALFFVPYAIDDTFPPYFPIIAPAPGIAPYFNTRPVVHSGIYRLCLAALAGRGLRSEE